MIYEVTDKCLQPMGPGPIVQRMLTNLKAIYLSQRDWPRGVRVLERLRVLCPRDWTQQRDLGAAWLQAGQPGKAISLLETYVANTHAAQDAQDADAVAGLLREARRQIAGWN